MPARKIVARKIVIYGTQGVIFWFRHARRLGAGACHPEQMPTSMTYFRLKSETVAIEYDGSGKGVCVTIPAKACVGTMDSVEPSQDHSRFVTVKWEDRHVHMFLVDLLKRGERVG